MVSEKALELADAMAAVAKVKKRPEREGERFRLIYSAGQLRWRSVDGSREKGTAWGAQHLVELVEAGLVRPEEGHREWGQATPYRVDTAALRAYHEKRRQGRE